MSEPRVGEIWVDEGGDWHEILSPPVGGRVHTLCQQKDGSAFHYLAVVRYLTPRDKTWRVEASASVEAEEAEEVYEMVREVLLTSGTVKGWDVKVKGIGDE